MKYDIIFTEVSNVMAKILGSWGGMRKYLEKEMLAESLKGRVRYGCTTYVGMDGCRIFEICVDGKQIKRFSWETLNTYFIEQGYKEESCTGDYWDEFWTLLDKYPIAERTEYTDNEFCDALEEYRNQDIRESIHSCNPLIQMFAILDRRAGKRTLKRIQDEITNQPVWLQQIYFLRIDAEKMNNALPVVNKENIK